VWHKHVEAAEKQLQELKNKILGKIVELLNTILSLSSSYKISLNGKGEITVAVDWDAWQWLGWKDYPSKNPAAAAQYQKLEENFQKELKIATRNVKQKQGESRATIKRKVERDRLIEELKMEVNEIRNKMENMITILAEETETNKPQPQTAHDTDITRTQ
jgi:hypothetical protein